MTDFEQTIRNIKNGDYPEGWYEEHICHLISKMHSQGKLPRHQVRINIDVKKEQVTSIQIRKGDECEPRIILDSTASPWYLAVFEGGRWVYHKYQRV